jgi:ABC-2 type transport system permease protein
MMMPMRVAAGGVPPAQMALALVLTAACADAAVGFGAHVYRGGIVRTGARTKLRDALRSVAGTG